MKNTARFLAIVMVVGLIAAAFSIAPAALDSGDWEIVCAPTGTPANAVMETTPEHGIRLSHEGHYPSSNAGLLYTKPLNIKDGISLNVTIETNNEVSSDAWFGFCLMNRPVYFDVTNREEDDGFGIILLCRPGNNFQWFTLSDAGFTPAVNNWAPDSDKEYYADEGVTIDFEIKFEDGALVIYVDGEAVDYDFADDLIPYLIDNQAYIGFSMSMTELEYQSFVINYLNGEKPASEGDAITKAEGEATGEETGIDFDSVNSFTLIDFTDPASINNLNAHNCKISYDETEGAVKVEVTGEDPYFNVPMKKNMYFDGDVFPTIKMEYKTDFAGESEFYFTTKDVPNMEYCNLQYDLEATNGEYKILDYDMQESAFWTGEIRNFRIDPAVECDVGTVFYYKSVGFENWEEPLTEAPETTEAQTDADPGTETAAEGSDVETADGDVTDENGSVVTDEAGNVVTDEDGKIITVGEDGTTAAVKDDESNNGTDTAAGSDGGLSTPALIGIIAGGVAAVAAIIAIILVVTKKKKQ